jgi:uncharacterized glyoxalase superfamily protein PhnB
LPPGPPPGRPRWNTFGISKREGWGTVGNQHPARAAWSSHLSSRAIPRNPICPYLLYEDTNAAIDWLVEAFGFREVLRYTDEESGMASHAELELEGGTIFLGWPGRDFKSPAKVGVTVGIHVYVADVDAHFERAKAAGANVTSEPHEPGYGDRRYDVDDLEGHHWYFATQLEQKAPEEWGAARPA